MSGLVECVGQGGGNLQLEGDVEEGAGPPAGHGPGARRQ